MDKGIMVESKFWHWIANPTPTRDNLLLYGWIMICSSLILTLLWLFYVKAKKDELKKKQSLWIALGFTIPVIIGIAVEIIFPLVFGLNDIPIAAPLVTVFSITTLMALTKYKFLNFSPKYQWNQIAESMSEGILIVDNNDQIVYANQPFCKLSGYNFEEIKGKLAGELFLDDAKQIKQLIEERKRKKTSQYEVSFKTKSEEKKWIIISGAPYFDKNGKVIGSIGIHTNITERKKIENRLRESETRLIMAQAVAKIGSWETNLLTFNVIWSRETYHIFEIDPEGFQVSHPNFLTYVHPEDRVKVDEAFIESFNKRSNNSIEHRIITPKGQIKFVEECWQIIHDDKGKPLKAIGTCQDITERKKAESILKATNKELELFIYKASHDLRGPLASILGLTSLSSTETKEAKTIEYIRMIEYSAKKLDATLSMLVQSVFIKDTKKFMDEIDFKWMIMETLAKLEHASGFARLQITTNVLQTFSFVSSKMIMQSLLQNLIENSVKYQDHKKANSFLNIQVLGNDKEVKIVMEDNGIGIDKSIQDNIFDMYYRGTNRSTGSGLGLYLVRTGVEKLGGIISLESELGKGCTFTITLPKKPQSN
ncbi:MAG: PAS domain-containing sensor histidine kinase [Bacteroidetes bacterium]|nr:PAS domain-containing sensor histidine kinase [Bacteroidota bacterium]